MTITNIIAGLQIIARHTDDPHCVCAEYDELLGGSSNLPLTPEERTEMERLGWRIDGQTDSWSAFV